jgi:hypothetical protein
MKNQRDPAIHVSTSQNSNPLLYWWEDEKRVVSKTIVEGLLPYAWARNSGPCGCENAWDWLSQAGTPTFRRPCSQNWSTGNCPTLPTLLRIALGGARMSEP